MQSTTIHVKAEEIAHELKERGFVEGPPAHLDPALVAGDVASYRRLCCPACGNRRHAVTPYHRGPDYALLACCKKCGAGTEC